MQAAQQRSGPGKRGRPRDPEIESKILSAALDLYGQRGWRAFNFDVLAKNAKIGKDALYRRWPSKGALLNDALRREWIQVETIDKGTLRADLTALGDAIFDTFAGRYAAVALYLRADTQSYEEVREFADPWREHMVQLGRAIIRRAIDRGELPKAANMPLILDTLIGAIINHTASTPERLRDRMLSQSEEFLSGLVDIIIQGTTGGSRQGKNA